MADAFRPVWEGLKDAAQHLVVANGEIQLAGAAIVRVTEAALSAKDGHEDLRETVHRLEGLVIQLSTEVRALRDAPPDSGVK
jgi:hypothetical protein